MKRIIWALLLTASLCGPGAAAAQSKAVPSDTVPNTDVGSGSGTLSDKLSRTGGIIHPQDSIDPAMQKPAPATGTMPVIPPPGSPGGETGVQPK